MRKVYSTDLSDREWASLKTHPSASMLPGTMRTHSLHEIFHAFFYVLKIGSPRRLGTFATIGQRKGLGRADVGFNRAK